MHFLLLHIINYQKNFMKKLGRAKPRIEKKGSSETLLRQGLRASKSVLLTVAVFSFFVNMSVLAIPFYMLQVFDRVLSSRSESTLFFLTLIVIFLILIFSVLDIARSWVMVRVANKVEQFLNPRVFNAVFERSVFISGGGHAQALRDLEMLRNFLSGKGLLAFFDAPWVPVFLVILFFFHPLIGTIALIGGAILLALAFTNEMMSRKAYDEISNGSAETSNFAEASLRNSEAIKAMGMLGSIRSSWQKKRNNLQIAQTKSNEQSAIIMAIAKFVRVSLQILVMGVGAYFVIHQVFTPGIMIAGSILMGRALAPLEQSVGQLRSLGMARAAYGRIQTLLENIPQQKEGMQLPVPTGEVTIQKLVVAPPGLAEPILKGVTAKLLPGESLGILGPSGAGKSTLARILVGVWPPRSGTVRLDNVDVYTWDSEQLGPHIGYLPQDVELFGGTVAENISRFSEAEAETIIAAARFAGMHEMILRLPEGYDTLIGEGGGNLSGGQRQGIGLARALFGQPKLVVLDEPNSNLDAEGEQALIRMMRKLKSGGTTLVVIAHRPNILGQVDKVMFLRNGRVEAFGPRQEVMQRLRGAAMAAGGNKGAIQP